MRGADCGGTLAVMRLAERQHRGRVAAIETGGLFPMGVWSSFWLGKRRERAN